MGCGASSAEYTEPRGDGKSGLYWAPTEQIHKLARSIGAASIESKMLVNQVFSGAMSCNLIAEALFMPFLSLTVHIDECKKPVPLREQCLMHCCSLLCTLHADVAVCVCELILCSWAVAGGDV